MDPSFLTAFSSISIKNTPKPLSLKLGIRKLSKEMDTTNKELKALHEILRRKTKKKYISKRYNF